jgi:hypothetical protein
MESSADKIILGFERSLNFTRGTETTTGKLLISRIEFVPERDCWACYWSLDFIKPDPEHVRLYGSDPLDCLTVVLWMVADLVRKSDNLQVWWKELGDYGGLPQIDGTTIRDRRAPAKKSGAP